MRPLRRRGGDATGAPAIEESLVSLAPAAQPETAASSASAAEPAAEAATAEAVSADDASPEGAVAGAASADAAVPLSTASSEPALGATEAPSEVPEDDFDDAEPEYHSDYDAEVASIFTEEASELIDVSEQALHAWRAQPDSADLRSALKRPMHTLKGGARMAGVTPMGDLSHELETLVMQMDSGSFRRRTPRSKCCRPVSTS